MSRSRRPRRRCPRPWPPENGRVSAAVSPTSAASAGLAVAAGTDRRVYPAGAGVSLVHGRYRQPGARPESAPAAAESGRGSRRTALGPSAHIPSRYKPVTREV